MQSTFKDEPATNAKVILFTSHGELEIQLWGRETPLATRNFLQHCMDKYYDNSIFHRMIPGFMIQGGDPTGTGTGGESIYGQPFKDQVHQRLKFTRRGLVAMANCGKDTNGSQFFITFGECQHLNRKHTIFGRVIGDTIYNLMAMQSIDTDDQDRPTNPPAIRRTKIVLNPFDDMVPRNTAADKPNTQMKVDTQAAKKEDLKKLKKKNRLTFDCEQVEEGIKVKSSHEVLKDSNFSNQIAVDQEELAKKLAEKVQQEQKKRTLKQRIGLGTVEEEAENALAEQQLKKKRKLNQQRQVKVEDEVLNYKTTFNVQTQRTEITWENLEKKKQQERQQQLRIAREKLRQETQGILADELNFKKVKEGSHRQKRKLMLNQQIELLSNAERMRYEFLKKKQQEKTDTNLFDKLNSFTGKLKNVSNKQKSVSWMRHKLKFHIDSEAAYRFDEKKRLVHEGQDDLDDGGLKVQVQRTEPLEAQFNVDQLYDMIHQDQAEEPNE